MNIYLNKEDYTTIRHSDSSAPYPGEIFEFGGKTWSVSKVEPVSIFGNFSRRIGDLLATCEEVKSYTAPIGPDELLRGLRFSPDGKSQIFEKDDRLWHRTRTENGWTDWVEYV